MCITPYAPVQEERDSGRAAKLPMDVAEPLLKEKPDFLIDSLSGCADAHRGGSNC